MHLASEYSTKPRIILTHNPASNIGLRKLSKSGTLLHNFRAIPDAKELNRQYRHMLTQLLAAGIPVADVADALSLEAMADLDRNPNSMFTRDPLITLPWSPNIAIMSNMRLEGRQSEPALIRQAAARYDITTFFEPPADIRLEGGDTLAVVCEGKRTLFVGVGARTSVEAGLWLAETLIRSNHLDEIVCVRHNQALLHLDTCFTMLPNKSVVCAHGSLQDGFVIDHELTVKPIRPLDYLKARGYKVLYLSREAAEQHENCNMLYLGDNRYLSFRLPAALSKAIEQMAGITITQIDGSEIAKANGGLHCLTRPLY